MPSRLLTVLSDRLHQAMSQSMRRKQRVAVVYLDVDGFKAVNDTYGHAVGDKLLVILAGKMKQVLRDSDTLARLGGDEFVAVMIDTPDRTACVAMLDRLLATVSAPVSINDAELQVSASLGVSFFPQDEPVDAEQLLRQADQAMYKAKLAGKNRFQFFEVEPKCVGGGRGESVERIRLALDWRRR
jgi:diguanylate cyclase (GGDEF)-like protein